MRQTQLDGVRGVGILTVIAFHHHVDSKALYSLGAVCMDLFFVLSGFLITRGLLHTRERPNYWTQFYSRRAARILPPLLVTLAIAPMFAPHLSLGAWFGYAFFMGNVLDLTKYRFELLFLLWSLAIEEHFYILWPVAVRFFSPQRAFKFALGIIVVAPLLRGLATPFVLDYHPIAYLTFFRVDSIAAGCLLALLPLYPRVERVLRRQSGLLFLSTTGVFVAFSLPRPHNFFWLSNTVLFNTLGYTLVVTACFFAIAYLLRDDRSPIAKILSAPPLVFLGEISYGLYLYHMMVLATTRKFLYTSLPFTEAWPKLFWIDMPIVILLAWLSYRFIELPIVEWCKRKEKTPVRLDPPVESERLPPLLAA